MAIFGAQDASGASFFDGIYDVLCTCLNFYTKKCNIKNYQKITRKQISAWCLAFLGSRPLAQTDPSSQGPFLTVFAMFYAHRALFKKRAAVLPRGGVGGTGHVPIKLKLRQRRMPCGPICPASDALCIAGFKTGWRLWPPTGQGGKQPNKNTSEASKGNQNQPYLVQLGEGLPTVFPPSFSRFYCPVFFLPPTVSDTVGFGYPQTGRQRRTTGHK